MTWRKLGFVELPTNGPAWMHSHAQLPTPMVIGPRSVRVFYASRTAEQRSHIGFTELEFSSDPDQFSIGRIADVPVLSPGPLGCFDEHGVFPASVIEHNGQCFMYYVGWNQGAEAPMFYASIGLAVSTDGLQFERVSPAPIMSRSKHDPCLVTSPHVYRDGDRWRMTYVSGTAWWRTPSGRLQSTYHIKNAASHDGLEWERDGSIAIDIAADETNVARSAVLKVADGDYRMWYGRVPATTQRYRIGYAESVDGSAWVRKDALAGIDLDDGHASEMICYPSLFSLGGDTYMLYNGNGNGRAGFGVARLV